MNKGPKTHHVIPNLHSPAVFLPYDRAFREQVGETRKRQDVSPPTAASALASLRLQAMPPTGWQRSLDLIHVASSTHSQITA